MSVHVGEGVGPFPSGLRSGGRGILRRGGLHTVSEVILLFWTGFRVGFGHGALLCSFVLSVRESAVRAELYEGQPYDDRHGFGFGMKGSASGQELWSARSSDEAQPLRGIAGFG